MSKLISKRVLVITALIYALIGVLVIVLTVLELTHAD